MSSLSWWTVFGVAAGTVSTLTLVYAVYFDYKRRSDPEFRRQIRLAYKKDLIQQHEKELERLTRLTSEENFPPLPTQPAQREQFMMEQLTKGERALQQNSGDFVENAAIHFYNALRAAPSPTQLLGLFQQSLPADVFETIVILAQFQKQGGSRNSSSGERAEID